MGYLKQAIIGTSWVSAFRISTRAISFVRILILARLLSPSSFGVFGIAALVLAFLEILTETGINIFLIQKKGNVDRYINDAWIISIARGTLLFFLLLFAAPFIANFFNAPQAILLIQLISLVPLIRGFINPSVIKYQKNLDFGKEFYFRFLIFMLDSTVAITFALIFRNAASFVVGLIAGAILEVILSFILLRPLPKLKFTTKYIREILRSGRWVTLYVLFNFIAQKGDNVVVGKLLGVAPLGIYEMGYNLSTLPISEVSDVVNKVVFPVFIQIKKNRARFRNAVFRTIGITTVVVFIFSITIFLLPKSFFIFLLGEKWDSVVGIIRILALYGLFRAILSVSTSVFLALERQKFIAIMTFVRVAALLIFIIPLTHMWGLKGASYAALLSVIFELPVAAYFSYKVFKNHL